MKEKAKGSDDTLSGGKWTGLIGWVGSFKVHFVTLQLCCISVLVRRFKEVCNTNIVLRH